MGMAMVMRKRTDESPADDNGPRARLTIGQLGEHVGIYGEIAQPKGHGLLKCTL